MPAPRKYPPELRERAVRLVLEAREQDPELSLNAAVVRIGAAGRGQQGHVARAGASRPRSMPVAGRASTTDERARIKELEREVARAQAGE